MIYSEVVAAWNAQADEHNQWHTLGLDEAVEFALDLQRKSFVYFLMEEHAAAMASHIADNHFLVAANKFMKGKQ